MEYAMARFEFGRHRNREPLMLGTCPPILAFFDLLA
jgi:hypothetical protein